MKQQQASLTKLNYFWSEIQDQQIKNKEQLEQKQNQQQLEQKKNQIELEQKQNEEELEQKLRKLHIEKKKKIKKSCLKYKAQYLKVPYLINPQHIYKVADAVVINEYSIRDPQNSSQSFLKTIFYLKRISTVNFNQKYLCLNLKKINQSYLSSEYIIQRFKSFGDKSMKQLADNLALLNDEFKLLKKQKCLSNQQNKLKYFSNTQENHQIHLAKVLQNFQNKKFICFYYGVSEKGYDCKKIIVSTELLRQLGFKLNQIAMDFIKYKHTFFQILQASTFKKTLELGLPNTIKGLRQVRNKNYQYQPQPIFMRDYVVREVHTDKGILQQKIKASIKLTKPQPYIAVFQVNNLQQNDVIPFYNRQKLCQSFLLEQQSISAQISSMMTLPDIRNKIIEQNKNLFDFSMKGVQF